MAEEKDTPKSGPARLVPFHTIRDGIHWRAAGRTPKVVLLDTGAAPLDLASLAESRATQLTQLLETLGHGVSTEIPANDVVGILQPMAQEVLTVVEALSRRLAAEYVQCADGAPASSPSA